MKWKIVFSYFHNNSGLTSVRNVFSNGSADIYGPSAGTVEPHAAANIGSMQELILLIFINFVQVLAITG